jgi:putative two-component system response regulator
MPLVTEGPIMQPTSSWIIRMVIYVSFAVLIHYYSDRISEEENLIQRKKQELLNAQESTLQALVNITETRDTDTKDYIDRIASYTRILLTLLTESNVYYKELSMIDIDCVARASSLHDIGKVAIPDTVLNKKGKLTSDEFEEMKLHTIKGAEALKTAKMKYPNNEFINSGYGIALHHHEWFDGSGYPSGLKGEMIPFTARVVSIVDVYDALRSERPYKKSISHEKAIEIMKLEQRHFDPIMFDVFLKHSSKFQTQY